ncbi:MAG: hypothetical protein GY953_25020 [bacterium]|nr:hypothetical protein [bacterium]
MFRIFRPRKLLQVREESVKDGWNSALDAMAELLTEHVWVVDEDDPHEIFCDGCGQSLTRALDGMRRR